MELLACEDLVFRMVYDDNKYILSNHCTITWIFKHLLNRYPFKRFLRENSEASYVKHIM